MLEALGRLKLEGFSTFKGGLVNSPVAGVDHKAII